MNHLREMIGRFGGQNTRLLVVIACALLIIPCISLLNNVAFAVDYDDIPMDLHDDYVADWQADDPRLIAHIRKYYLFPPAPRSAPYNLLYPNKKDWSHKGQSMLIADLLKHKRNGVFFEAGAYDGETYSNSLYFEKYLNWTGVMVEPDWANIKRFRKKNRKCWLVRGCIEGTSNTPKKMELMGAMEVGTLASHASLSRKVLTKFWRPVKYTTVWCWPLQSILLAANMTKLDIFTLDIEGVEIPVMESTPWNKIDVDVFQVEYGVFAGAHLDRDWSSRRRERLRQIFRETLPQHSFKADIFVDLVYAKSSLID